MKKYSVIAGIAIVLTVAVFATFSWPSRRSTPVYQKLSPSVSASTVSPSSHTSITVRAVASVPTEQRTLSPQSSASGSSSSVSPQMTRTPPVSDDHIAPPAVPAAPPTAPNPCRLVSSTTDSGCIPCPPRCTGHLCPLAAGVTNVEIACSPVCGYAPTASDIMCEE